MKTATTIPASEITSIVNRLTAQRRRTGGSVYIPEVEDLLKQSHPELTTEAYHAQLLELHQSEIIYLHICNTPHLLDSEGRGIDSNRGRLLFIEVR